VEALERQLRTQRVEHQWQREELEGAAAAGGGGRGFGGPGGGNIGGGSGSTGQPDTEEQTAQQKAILESFESLKKLENDGHTREEDNEEHRERLREDRERRCAAYEKLGFGQVGLSNAPSDGQ
jgi:Asp-tRNA(Asn)/Glu-tRNA(Gln) amidotransferase C subunit